MIRTQHVRRFATSTATKHTALFDNHVALGGKMVDFAGYKLPVQYPTGVMKEHLHTRDSASLFDVSHMGQVVLTGDARVDYLESLVVGEIRELQQGTGRLSLITNENGGIMDDTVITNAGDHIYMVVNGACKDKDLAHMNKHLSNFAGVELDHLTNHSLLALQGPKAKDALARLIPDSVNLADMSFMTSQEIKVAGMDCRVTRCGYTGEDGFEISMTNADASQVMNVLLDNDIVLPAGLGARDSLRLEAGLCLYGNDLDEETSPVEGTLLWTVGKRRRAEGGFVGADAILDQIKNRPDKKRVGLVIDGRPAREGCEIYDASGDAKIGVVTSGTYSPCLKKPIAMGYVTKSSKVKNGSAVLAKVGKKMVPATVTKMPFVPANYYHKE